MNYKSKTAVLTLWVNRVLVCAVVALVPLMPRILEWYNTVRILTPGQDAAIRTAFYCCVPAVLFALLSLDRLLANILEAQVFTRRNVKLIGRVRLCCAAVSLICLPASLFYPPLVFMVIIMGFLCPVISVVKQVIRAAVDIKEENDMTI